MFSCASSTAWVGKDVRDLYRELGPPDQVIDDPECAGCRIHVYERVTRVQELPMPDGTTVRSGGNKKRRAFYTSPAGTITKVREP